MMRAIMAMTWTAATPQMKNWIVSDETFQARSPIGAVPFGSASLLTAPIASEPCFR